VGRPSKLTETQWEEIKQRLLDGENSRTLGKEFGVAESAIRQKVSAQVKQIKAVANQMLATEAAFKALPIPAQITAQTLANKLRSISENLATAAEYSAINSSKLSALAHSKIDQVTPENLDDHLAELQTANVLMGMATEASKIPMGLLNANKDQLQVINAPIAKELKQWTNEELLEYATKGI